MAGHSTILYASDEIKPDLGDTQEILVFQQAGSGENKIEGIRKHGDERIVLRTTTVESPMTPLLDDAREYLPDHIEASLVLDFLKHPDLSHALAELCNSLKIPLVASGKKHRVKWALTPPV
jgi:hypothetical protein